MRYSLPSLLLLLGLMLSMTDLQAQSRYQFQRPWNYTYDRIKTDEGLWGISINRKKDSLLVEPVYNFIESDVVWGKYAVVNKGGEESKYAPFAAGGKFGMIKPQGDIVVPLVYDWIDGAVAVKGGKTQIGYAENEFALHLGGEWGIINAEGQPLELARNYCFIHAVSFKDEAERFASRPNWGFGKYNRMFFYANSGGKLEAKESGLYRVSGGTVYVLNEEGEEILSFSCDRFEAAPGGRVFLEKNGKDGKYHPDQQKMEWK